MLKKKHIVLGISLIVIIIIAIPLSCFIAQDIVSDAFVKLGFEDRGSIHVGIPNVSFVGNFTFMNGAGIPLTIDYVNITVLIWNSNSHYDGNLCYVGTTPLTTLPGNLYVGNMVAENELVPAKGQVVIPANFYVTSEDALNVIHGGNYTVGWRFNEITVSASFLFWHFTQLVPLE